MNHEIHEIHEKNIKPSTDDAFILQFWIVAKVDQQTKFVASGFQIVVDLGAVRIGQLRYGLDFHNNPVETNKVRLISLFERHAFVSEMQIRLPLEGDVLRTELDLQAFLIGGLKEPASLLFVHFKL